MVKDTRSDQEIVRDICLLNKKELFEVIIDRYEEKITRYVMRFTQGVDDVADIVQVVFIKSYTHLNSFDTNQPFNPWIYRIAHNECVNFLTKKGKEKVSFIDFDVIFPTLFAKEDTSKNTLDRELRTTLDASLALLPPKYREPLILYYFEEFSYQEIADILHIPISTVGVRIKRGKEQLQEKLKSYTL